MVFAVAGGGQLDTGGYQIDNSLRFNDDDSPYLSKSFTSVTSTKKFTVSFWFKPSAIPQSNYSGFLDVGGDNAFALFADSTIYFFEGGGAQFYWRPKMLFRDCSAWYHVVLACDSTLATQTDRVKIYINGVLQTDFYNNSGPSQNYDFGLNTTGNTRYIGTKVSTSSYYDGYLAEYYQIDGQQLDASSFGEFDADSGIWKPIQYTGTFGDAGYYLDFENSGSLGADQSGNGNNFTPTNLASTDQTTDTPTNNFCTLNFLDTPSGSTFSEGNLKIDTSVGQEAFTRSTIGLQTGKWYFEAKITTSNVREAVGIYKTDATLTDGTARISYYSRFGHILKGNTLITTGATFGNGDIIGTAFDLDASTVSFYKNGSLQGTVTSIDSSTWTPMFQDASNAYACGAIYNFGNPPTGFTISSGNSDDNGYGNFEYAPPSGYLALCTQNLATELSPTIDDASQYFNTVLYSGNSTTNRTVTGVGFQPDFTWFKGRTPSAIDHALFDSNRGATKILISNNTNAEITVSESLKSFDSDGVTLGNDLGDYGVNNSARTYALWSWKANGGTTSSNTDGTITSTVQANPTAGFSIVTFTGNGSGGATVGHGLGKTPSVLIQKRRNSTSGWPVYHQAYGINNYTFLHLTDANIFNSTGQTWVGISSSTFSLGTAASWNANGGTYVTYCFAEIEGYSKFGKYTGNGSTDGTFVYTGFRPSFVLTKRTDVNGYSWGMADSKRSPYNQANEHLFANASDTEYTTLDKKDLLSNGFKHRTNLYGNLSGGTYIYMAFAESPFVTSGAVPVTAR
jgi:hypothetical protein